LSDLVGNDVMWDIARNLAPAIPHDEARPLLDDPHVIDLYTFLLSLGWLGSKSGVGFYKLVRADNGEKQFWPLDLTTRQHVPPAPLGLPEIDPIAALDDLGERLRALLTLDTSAGRFVFAHHAFLLTYAAARIPEIADSYTAVDAALKWGFGHALGPFEIWDVLGLEATIPVFEAAGYPVAAWVKARAAAGQARFYPV
jgi:3-hydroxyacyl-CoA dehydrogenase